MAERFFFSTFAIVFSKEDTKTYLLKFSHRISTSSRELESKTMLLLELRCKRRLQPLVTWGRAEPGERYGVSLRFSFAKDFVQTWPKK